MGIMWKTCSLAPDYSVSNYGLIYDEKRGLLVSQHTNEDGYKKVTLRISENERKTFSVHRLVAVEFVDNPFNKETVNHLDGQKGNNFYANLVWATRSEQTQHAWDNGLIKDLESRKENIRQKQGKPIICITTEEIWDSIGRAAEELGLRKSNISAVCLNKKGFKSAGKTPDGQPRVWRFFENE